ncbi:Histone deacetylase HDT1 [Capsicum chinense]|nr:Histone deacetylase HDT1 [Capsicum chinense]
MFVFLLMFSCDFDIFLHFGAEVKSGEPLSVQPGDGMVLHLSQASLGELKNNKSENVCLSVNIDDKKLVLGTLNSEKSGVIVFSESDEDIPLTLANNGRENAIYHDRKPEAGKPNAGKDSTSGKQVKIVEPSKDGEDDSSDDDEDDSDGGEDEDDSDDSDESEEETPKKAEPSKKRKADSATKTPVTDKKAKLTTPQKTDGKKGGGHVATPHPSKQAGKTPKSAGTHHCKPCNRSFGSEGALDSHTKAKHSAGK